MCGESGDGNGTSCHILSFFPSVRARARARPGKEEERRSRKKKEKQEKKRKKFNVPPERSPQ